MLNRPVSHALPAAEPKEKIDKVLLAKFLFVLILFLATVIGCVMFWRRSSGTYTETEINGVYWRSTVQLSNIVKFDTTDSSGKTVRYSAYPDGRAVIAEGNASTEPYYADFTLEEDETEKFRRIEYFVQIKYEGAPLRLRVSRDQYDMLAGNNS